MIAHAVEDERAEHFARLRLRENALLAVSDERNRQDEKWGVITSFESRAPERWLAILMEEAGELAKASLDECCGGPPAREQMACMREEATHVAAVAVSLIEWLDYRAPRIAPRPLAPPPAWTSKGI